MINLGHQGFTELKVWQKARELKIEIHNLTLTFPAEEKYRLSNQLIRSSRSVTSNIAEGHGRLTYKDQLHFCIQARGSLSETYNHLCDAFDCKYMGEETFLLFQKKISEVTLLLNGYMKYLKQKIGSK